MSSKFALALVALGLGAAAAPAYAIEHPALLVSATIDSFALKVKTNERARRAYCDGLQAADLYARISELQQEATDPIRAKAYENQLMSITEDIEANMQEQSDAAGGSELGLTDLIGVVAQMGGKEVDSMLEHAQKVFEDLKKVCSI